MFGLDPLHSEAEPACNIERKVDLLARKGLRGPIVGHEPSGQLAVRRHQRNERERPDAFPHGCRFERIR